MAAATGLKTKKTLLERVAPPREITNQIGAAATKARRAWIAAKIAEILQTPGRECKVVGKGSYETIHVYELTQTEGRLRHRGHCQACGNDQVVEGDRLVLHGYKRPGDGYTIGRCPGIPYQPLERDQQFTETALRIASKALAEATAHLEKAKAKEKAALEARYPADGRRPEQDATMHEPTQPQEPWKRASTAEQAAYLAVLEAYKVALVAWAKRYPLTAAYRAAEKATRIAEREKWQITQEVTHFQRLLDQKYLGQPLIEEVLA